MRHFFETITESDLRRVKLKLTLMRLQMDIFHFCDEIVSVSHNLINFIARFSLSTEIRLQFENEKLSPKSMMPVIYIQHAFNIKNQRIFIQFKFLSNDKSHILVCDTKKSRHSLGILEFSIKFLRKKL